jgi:hypothetical protein
MTEENLKMIAQSIAKKEPLEERALLILKILEDLNAYIVQKEHRANKYIT